MKIFLSFRRSVRIFRSGQKTMLRFFFFQCLICTFAEVLFLLNIVNVNDGGENLNPSLGKKILLQIEFIFISVLINRRNETIKFTTPTTFDFHPW